MTASRAWIESRHLREQPGGAAALAALAALDDGARERILSRGDAIAERSASLAHAFLAPAVRAAGAGSRAFDAWESMFLDVVGSDAPNRELALAFLGIEPTALAAFGEGQRAAWAGAVASLGAASRRLAVAFVQSSAGALAPVDAGDAGASPAQATGEARTDQGPSIAAEAFDAWSACAHRTLSSGGWRAEFLAEAFLAGGATLLGLLEVEAVPHWARVVELLGSSGRNPRPPSPPEALAAMPRRAATHLLEACAAAAAYHPKAAAKLLETGPAAARALGEGPSDRLFAACARCGAHEPLADALALLPGVLHGVPREARGFLLDCATRIADSAPSMLPPFLRTMDRAIEGGGREGVELWVERGLELAVDSPEAATAHFHLESRTSHKLLVERSAAVSFEEVEGMLRRYLTMMSRRTLQLLPSAGVWIRPPLAAPEDNALRLPERVDLFDTSEDNQALYKAIATHIAARFEYGTYDLDLEELAARGWTPPAVPEEGPPGRDVVSFLACFPNPLLASALFVLLDGIRLDAALERDFPGLRREIARVGALYASTVVPGALDRHDERLLATLFQMGVAKRDIAELDASLRAQGEVLASSVALLRTKEATVYDSAALTVAFYGGLAYAEARAMEEGDEVAFVEMGGATVVDPFEHLDGGERQDNTAPWRPDPARAEPRDQSGKARLQLSDDDGSAQGSGRPLSLEELKKLLERGGDLRISEAQGRIEEGLGLYITDLLGKVPAEQLRELREKLAAGDAGAVHAWLARQAAGTAFFYDEWDHRIGDYRRRWCRVTEIDGDEDAGEYFQDALARSGELVGRIKRDFQMLRPDQMRRVPRTEQGEEFDLNALVEAHSDRRGRRTPSDRLYVARKPEERDVATLFLLDMSASTDEPLPGHEAGAEAPRVIDLTKDTVAVLSQVLDEIGDSFAVYGFSGHGRDNVEVYHVKSFGERLSDRVKGRIGGIAPKRSTRMGAALRHAGEKLARTTARARHLILLSDGFPQDFDYGDDRRSNVYGIRDTMQALRELEKRGMQTFCITVDPAGHDYLGEMCPSSRYAVIEDIAELPSELVRIYRRVTRG